MTGSREEELHAAVSERSDTGYASAAATGSAWTTAQTVANKFVTVFAMLAIARFLSPAEVGLANSAASIGAFVFVFAPFVMGDVLLAEPKRFTQLANTGSRIAWVAGWIMFAILAALAIPIERWSDKSGLAFLVVIAALRPLADSVLMLGYAHARVGLEYRCIAKVEGLVNLSATVAGVAMAWLGAGPISVTLPPIAALACKGVLYRRSCSGFAPFDRAAAPEITRRFSIAAIGQYANNVLQILETLVLLLFASETEIGYFGLAFQLAVQANTVVAAQLGAVLQPIFAHIQHDPVRQVAGFVRATRLLSGIAVPMSAMQAALAIPTFAILFEEKWTGAIAPFIALSIAQSFMFVTAPSIALLKSQGRFGTYLRWQFGQLALSALLFIGAVQFGSESALQLAKTCGVPVTEDCGHALAIALASACAWAISCPIAVHLGGAPARLPWRTTIAVFVQPWLIAGPCALLTVLVWHVLRRAIDPFWADVVTLTAVGPAFLIAGIIGCLMTRRESREDFQKIASRFTRRLKRG